MPARWSRLDRARADRANPSPVPWTQEELFTFLRTGVSSLHGAAAATMTPVIREALALPVVPDSDVRAIAVYFSDMDQAAARASSVEATVREAIATSYLAVGQEYDADANLYASACMRATTMRGRVPLPARPELALNSALTLPEPTNFIQVVLRGIGSTDGAPGLVMPAYASSYRHRNGQARGLSAPHPHKTAHPGPTWKRRSPLPAGSRRGRINENGAMRS